MAWRIKILRERKRIEGLPCLARLKPKYFSSLFVTLREFKVALLLRGSCTEHPPQIAEGKIWLNGLSQGEIIILFWMFLDRPKIIKYTLWTKKVHPLFVS